MTRDEYREVYLRSDHWRTTRAAALERAEHRCQVCNAAERLDVHHRTYERLGAEKPSDLTVLCRRCHSLFHGEKAAPRARKPRTVKVSAQKTAVRSVRCPRCQAEPGEKCRRKGQANHIERVAAHEGTDWRQASQHRLTPKRHLAAVEDERKLSKGGRQALRISSDPAFAAYRERMQRAKQEFAEQREFKPWDTASLRYEKQSKGSGRKKRRAS